jgi:hypothetical protein
VSDSSQPGIWHLLLWMTCCAVYFSLMKLFLPASVLRPADVIRLSLFALFTGLCWTGALLAIGRMVRGSGPALEPGMWLLFTLGCVLAVDFVVALLPDRSAVRPLSLHLAAGCLTWVAPMLSRRLPGRWKALFAVMAVLSAAKLLWLIAAIGQGLDISRQYVHGYALVQLIAGLAVLSIVVLRDWQAKQRDSWLHWMGIVCLVVWLGWCASSTP